jgi:hypothetical protein
MIELHETKFLLLSVDGGMCRNAVEIGRNTEVTAAAIVAVEKMAAEMVVIVTRMIIVAVIRRHVSETTDGWLKRESGRLNLGNVVGVISVVLAICRRVVSVSVSVALDAEKRIGRARGTIATGR